MFLPHRSTSSLLPRGHLLASPLYSDDLFIIHFDNENGSCKNNLNLEGIYVYFVLEGRRSCCSGVEVLSGLG